MRGAKGSARLKRRKIGGERKHSHGSRKVWWRWVKRCVWVPKPHPRLRVVLSDWLLMRDECPCLKFVRTATLSTYHRLVVVVVVVVVVVCWCHGTQNISRSCDCLVMVRWCSCKSALSFAHVMCRRAKCSTLKPNTIFDNKYYGIFHVEFQWNPYGLLPWNPYGLVHGIQGGYAPIPYGIPDVHGTTNWLRPQPT